MTPQLTPTGISPSTQYLTISVCIKQSASDQFSVVRVPLNWFLSSDILSALDRAHRARLEQVSVEQALQAALF